MSQEQVALSVGIDAKTLRNYLACRTMVDPRYLAALADAVGASVLEWAAMLGFVPEQLLLAGQSLERARRQVADLEAHIAKMQHAGVGSWTITQAALASETFTIEIEPRSEGPAACRIRVGDVLRIRRSDRQPFALEEIRSDPLLGSALSAANAVRQSTDLWADDESPDRDLTTDRHRQWVWIVPRFNITRPHSLLPIRMPIRSVAIVSTQLSAWTADVASLVGPALGYGTASTSVLSRTAFGEQLSDERHNDPLSERAPVRAAIAADLLTLATTAADLTVWAHASIGAYEDFRAALTRAHGDVFVIYLRPTDQLHQYVAQREWEPIADAELDQSRADLDATIAAYPTTTLTLDVGFPSDFEPGDELTLGIRDAFLERSIITALRILEYLHQHHGGPKLDQLHDDTQRPFRNLAATFAEESQRIWDKRFGLTPGREFR